MINSYWQKQAKEPLFPTLFWDKPEGRNQAGKLLVIGGNAHSFTAPAAAYQSAQEAGVGVCKVLLPDSLKPTVGKIFDAGEYAPSNKSGSFNRQSLSDWMELSAWADGIFVAGDLGRNSETAIVLEQFVEKFSGLLTLSGDAMDYFTSNPTNILERENSILVVSFAQLQKLGIHARLKDAFTYEMPIANMAELLHQLTLLFPVTLIIKHGQTFFVSYGGEVITTTVDNEDDGLWRVSTAARVTVWALQNPGKILEATASGIYEIAH